MKSRLADRSHRSRGSGGTLGEGTLIAVIEHDAIPFVNKAFGGDFPKEDARLSQMRNLTKSLNSKYLNYQEYSKQANIIMQQLKFHFKHYQGPLAFLLNPFTPDVGVTYYQGMPIYCYLYCRALSYDR
jgi:hypothetical protein